MWILCTTFATFVGYFSYEVAMYYFIMLHVEYVTLYYSIWYMFSLYSPIGYLSQVSPYAGTEYSVVASVFRTLDTVMGSRSD